MDVYKKFSDDELIARYAAGDVHSVEVLINRYKSKVYSYILMVVKDDFLADDIFQETFIKVVQTLKVGAYKEEGKFIRWINRIAHNLIMDYYRKDKRSGVDVEVPVEKLADSSECFVDSTESSMIRLQSEDQMMKLVEMLPVEQSEVVKLRHYCNMSFKDIAALTDVSINTALGRMRYAIINMRKIIDERKISVWNN